MAEIDLKRQLAGRFHEGNGHHTMTDPDGAYVSMRAYGK